MVGDSTLEGAFQWCCLSFGRVLVHKRRACRLEGTAMRNGAEAGSERLKVSTGRLQQPGAAARLRSGWWGRRAPHHDRTCALHEPSLLLAVLRQLRRTPAWGA